MFCKNLVEVKDVSNQGIIFSGTNVSVNRSDNKKESYRSKLYASY